MDHTPSEVELIDTMAKEQFKYESIFSTQAKCLRTDPSNSEAAMARIKKSLLVAKPGEHWEPLPDAVEQYLMQCNDICEVVPQNFDELSLLESVWDVAC